MITLGYPMFSLSAASQNRPVLKNGLLATYKTASIVNHQSYMAYTFPARSAFPNQAHVNTPIFQTERCNADRHPRHFYICDFFVWLAIILMIKKVFKSQLHYLAV